MASQAQQARCGQHFVENLRQRQRAPFKGQFNPADTLCIGRRDQRFKLSANGRGGIGNDRLHLVALTRAGGCDASQVRYLVGGIVVEEEQHTLHRCASLVARLPLANDACGQSFWLWQRGH